MRRKPLLGIGWVAAAILLFGCSTLPGSATREMPTNRGGGPRSYALAGTLGPVVLLEAGLGDGKESWEPILSGVSRFARPFAYDRAGYGQSQTNSPVRDGDTIVREARELLAELELPPPYLLVGHSLGGQFVELFARQHPEEVLGVLLVESRNATYSARCERAGIERCPMPRLLRMILPAAARHEVDAAPRTEAQIQDAPPFPDVPLIVLTATRRPGSSEALKRLWAETQAELAELSPQGRQQICDECGHYLHHDAPSLVVEAIRSLAEHTPE
jgi:pimeloyl-ACP methyl ester carboxylesterase